MNFAIKSELEENDLIGFKNSRRNLKYRKHQIGKSNTVVDASRKALLAGKKISKNGNVYYEYRKNRVDLKGSNI